MSRVTPGELPLPRRTALAVLMLLAGCARGDEPPAMLSPFETRTSLYDHLMEVAVPGGDRYLIRFERGDRAEIIGENAEFARWYTDLKLGLCLQQYRLAPRCAPLYALNLSHYRWGDATLSDLTVRSPGGDFSSDRGVGMPFPRR